MAKTKTEKPVIPDGWHPKTNPETWKFRFDNWTNYIISELKRISKANHEK